MRAGGGGSIHPFRARRNLAGRLRGVVLSFPALALFFGGVQSLRVSHGPRERGRQRRFRGLFTPVPVSRLVFILVRRAPRPGFGLVRHGGPGGPAFLPSGRIFLYGSFILSGCLFLHAPAGQVIQRLLHLGQLQPHRVHFGAQRIHLVFQLQVPVAAARQIHDGNADAGKNDEKKDERTHGAPRAELTFAPKVSGIALPPR